MIEERQETPGEKETSRLEAFSDGVFAVAITLLVFGLQVPTLDNPYTSDHLVRVLLLHWPSYLAFFISFHSRTWTRTQSSSAYHHSWLARLLR